MECYLGQIELFPFSFAPYCWKLCNGEILPIAQYSALFSLIGIHYGGDGINNFALPDLRGTEPIPYTNYYICVQGGVWPPMT